MAENEPVQNDDLYAFTVDGVKHVTAKGTRTHLEHEAKLAAEAAEPVDDKPAEVKTDDKPKPETKVGLPAAKLKPEA